MVTGTTLSKAKKYILLVDPAIQTPEASVYNLLSDLADEVSKFNGVSELGVRFWLPALGQHRTLEEFLNANSELRKNIVGCVVLGSYAHVTEASRFAWFKEFENLLQKVLQSGLPFFGICFAHQFLAARAGWKVSYCKDAKVTGCNRYVAEFRRLSILSERLKVLSSSFSSADWNHSSLAAFGLKEVFTAIANGALEDSFAKKPHSAVERLFAAALKAAPSTLCAWSRHEQHVSKVSAKFEFSPAASDWRPSLSNADFQYDGLVHRKLPIFTFQTHPERPLTAESRFLLRNFLLLCGLFSGRCNL